MPRATSPASSSTSTAAALCPPDEEGGFGRPAALASGLAEPKALQLARVGAGQFGNEADLPRAFVRRDLGLRELLQRCDRRFTTGGALPQNDERGDRQAAALVRKADDTALRHIGMTKQCLLDLGRRDVVARGDDQIVGPRLIPEVAVGVLGVRVACDVPPVLYVRQLTIIVEIPTPGRPSHRKAAEYA